MTMDATVFWDVTPYGFCKNRRFVERIAAIIMVERISGLGTMLAATEAHCEETLLSLIVDR
jgi:hypothetical protein